MDVATQVYIKYTQVYAAKPQSPQQLIAFSRLIKDITSVKWMHAKSVLLSPPEQATSDHPCSLTLKDSVKPPIKIGIESILADLSLDNISQQIWRESRKPTNMVLLLDISDSMNDHVEDRHSSKHVICRYRTAPYVTFTVYDFAHYGARRSRIEKAKQQCISLLQQLASHDRVAVIAFDDSIEVVQEMQCVKDVNMRQLTQRVKALQSGHCTYLQDAHSKAIDLMKQYYQNGGDDEHERYDHKIVIVSDLPPNSVQVKAALHNTRMSRCASHCVVVEKR